MRPTDDLREEHIAVKQMLRILDGICTNIDSGGNVEQEHLNGLVEFMKVFVDKCHHTKEEIYLFPEMKKAGISGVQGTIASLKKEHEIGRQYVSKIENAIYRKENNRALQTMVENSRAYIQLLIPHIEIEENNIFPIADANLSQEVQRALLESFEVVETEIIGPGQHEKFHKWLHTMEEIYVNPK